MRIEERRVVELQDGQVDARCDGHHRCRHLVARRVGLDLNLAGVENHVRIGQDAPAFDHHPGSGYLARRLLGPGLEGIRVAHGRKDLDHRILNGRRPVRVCRPSPGIGRPSVTAKRQTQARP